MQRIRALYYGQISHVDHAVGRVVEELERLDLTRNTVILFCSDHGEMLGDHGLSQKFVPYEASIRIPLILIWPGRTKAGKVCHELVGLTDILPTLIHGLGLTYPANQPAPVGESLISAAGGGLLSGRDAFVIDYGAGRGRWISIRTQNRKYALWAADGFEEMYDLRADPEERHNIAGANLNLKKQLRSRLIQWERDQGLPASFEGERFRVYASPSPPRDLPRTVVINEGRWPENLPEDERGTVESYAEAFDRAISNETSLAPEKLNLKDYKKKSGTPLIGTRWERAWREA
jgi:arylsulfatase A-like enzyme